MSLSEIIETILLLNETSGRTEIKLCKHCGKLFIAKNIKAEYHTEFTLDEFLNVLLLENLWMKNITKNIN